MGHHRSFLTQSQPSGALASDLPVGRSAFSKPAIAALADRFAPEAQSAGNSGARSRLPDNMAVPSRLKSRGFQTSRLIYSLVCVAVVPAAILSVPLWHGMELTQPVQGSNALEIVLSSPDRIDTKAGDEIDFPIAIDATDTLPSRTVIAVSGMPEGASFSEGRPYGLTGWSLRPDEIGELRLRLPEARSAASDMRIDLLAADGAVLAQSETRLRIAANPAENETMRVVDNTSFQQIANVDTPVSTEALPPPPQRKPASPARNPLVNVTTVKVMTIKPPRPTRPHDGALALGDAAEPSAEWVEVVRPVNVHSQPQNSSKTVKVAGRGHKLRVTARDKDWVQVSDPKKSVNGWIYASFLKPTKPPAQ
jgi:hypothetical protein